MPKKTYCAYPFFHIQVKPNGVYKPCCRFDIKEAEKLQSSADPYEAFNSNYWNHLRTSLTRNEEIKGCIKCYQQEEATGSSMRMSDLAAQRQYDVTPDKTKLTFLEVGFGNLCNLKCRSCAASLSSKWYDDEKLLNEKTDFRQKKVPQKQVIESNFLKHIDPSVFLSLQDIKFTGGEPMLHKDFLEFLNRFNQLGRAQEVRLRVCTNATYWPKNQLIKLLSQFKSVEISLSIDGTGHHNDYLRNPSNWSTVEDISLKWISLSESHHNIVVNLCTTISAPSLYASGPLLNWWSAVAGERDIIFQPVYDPHYLSPEVLPTWFIKQEGGQTPKEIRKFFSSKKASTNHNRQFFIFNDLLDKNRKESLEKVFPGFRDLRKWVYGQKLEPIQGAEFA